MQHHVSELKDMEIFGMQKKDDQIESDLYGWLQPKYSARIKSHFPLHGPLRGVLCESLLRFFLSARSH